MYGADAIAGVVNFITRREFQGVDATVYISQPNKSDGTETGANFTTGFGNFDKDRYSIVASFGYADRAALAATDRDFAKTGRFTVDGYEFLQGSPRSIPGNVTIPSAADPNAVLRNPAFINGACPAQHFPFDGTCYYDFASELEIYPRQIRRNALLSGQFKISDNHTLFGEYVYSDSATTSRLAPPPGNVSLTAASPFYPTAAALGANGQPVVVNYRVADAGKRTTIDKSISDHAAFGLRGLLAGWDYNAAVTYSKNEYQEILDGGWVQLRPFLAALGSGAINPFLPPGQQSSAAQAAINNSIIRGYFNGGTSELTSYEVRGSREIFALPAGMAQLAVGAGFLNEKFDTRPSPLAQGTVLTNGLPDTRFGDTSAIVEYDAKRDAYNAFVELLTPLARNLEMTFAGRFDDYSDFGSNTTGKVALRYQPVQQLLLRGSLGTGFKAPTVPQIAAPRQSFGVTSDDYTCPFTPAQLAANFPGVTCPTGDVQYDTIAAGNRDLKPEKSTQFAFGFRWEPTAALSVGVDYWNVKIKDQIGQIDEQTVFSDPQRYIGQFTSFTDPGTGQVLLAYLANNVNLGEARFSGLDFDVRGRLATPIGRLTSQLTATYMLVAEQQTIPGGEFISNLGKFELGEVTQELRGRWTNSLATGAFTNTLTINYTSGYDDQPNFLTNLATGVDEEVRRKVGSYLTVDWQTRWQVSKNLGLTVGVLNLLNEDPPRTIKSNGGGQSVGWDSRYADPRGRTVQASLNLRF